MILSSDLRGIWQCGIEQELRIVFTIGNSHVDATQHVTGWTTSADILESKFLSTWSIAFTMVLKVTLSKRGLGNHGDA